MERFSTIKFWPFSGHDYIKKCTLSNRKHCTTFLFSVGHGSDAICLNVHIKPDEYCFDANENDTKSMSLLKWIGLLSEANVISFPDWGIQRLVIQKFEIETNPKKALTPAVECSKYMKRTFPVKLRNICSTDFVS